MYRSLVLTFVITMIACDGNFLAPFVTKDSDEALVVEAEKQIDNEDFTAASSTLAKVKDSNERRLLQIAALLGGSGLSIWQYILDTIDNNGLATKSTGVDGILDALIESIFGTGEVRAARLKALSTAIALIQTTPKPEAKMDNIGCLLGSLLAVPRAADAIDSLAIVQTTLTAIGQSASGTGSTAAECPDLGEFTTALETLKTIREDLDSVLISVRGCSFLDFSQAEASLNVIEKLINKVNDNADKGCAPVVCTNPICAALQLGCVQTVLSDPLAKDGLIAACELVQNCINPLDCFTN